MQAPAGSPSLPLTLQVAGLTISVLLAVIRIFEFANRAKLSIHLTKDLFFRVIDEGEALFCHAVLLASNGPVLIHDISFLLKRVDKNQRAERAEKSFPLEAAHHGEVIPGPDSIAEHKFFGSSPLLYLGPNTPYRAVYACLQREYREKQKNAAEEFVADMQKFRTTNSSIANSTPEPEEANRLLSELGKLVDKHYNSMANLIQLESGDYELTLKVTYESIGRRLWKRTYSTSSKVAFTVDNILIENWKAGLYALLQTRAQQIVGNTSGQVIYPTMVPTQITELPNG